MLRGAAEAVTSALAIRNHGAVANTIGTGTAAAGGAGHPRVAEGIVVSFRIVLFGIFSHRHRLLFSSLAAFQVIGTDDFKAGVELFRQLRLFLLAQLGTLATDRGMR